MTPKLQFWYENYDLNLTPGINFQFRKRKKNLLKELGSLKDSLFDSISLF